MIRLATEADLPRIVEMSMNFHAVSGYADIPLCERSVEATARLLMSCSALLVAEARDGELVGMIGAVFSPSPMNDQLIVGQEIIWWLEPNYRGGLLAIRLLQALEVLARGAGVHHFSMINIASSAELSGAGSLYARLGYKHTESTWTKDLQHGH